MTELELSLCWIIVAIIVLAAVYAAGFKDGFKFHRKLFDLYGRNQVIMFHSHREE